MKILDQIAFKRARAFIMASGWALEQARYRYVFEGGSASEVLDALATFRNEDGGFGKSLEPDLQAPHSSALCTSVAFQTLRSLKADSGDAMVRSGISYLLATHTTTDGKANGWRIIPESAGQYPHAPWWNQEGRGEELARFSLNPSAELLGYFYDYRSLVPLEVIQALSDRVLEELNGVETIEMHQLLCCLRLWQTRDLPNSIRDALKKKLATTISGAVAKDPAEWEGYSLRPLQVVDGRNSPFITGLEDSVQLNLDYEIASQNKDGSWSPTWNWGDAFPDVWPRARTEWSGILTMQKLILLKRFGRIEGVTAGC
ncbi:MAG TPA: hypothetical protein VK970_22230 [Candidatus Methylacidiphilales bacterium]|nr:hypothetical protein [Candidatus Methylacidiphilales bacterium]